MIGTNPRYEATMLNARIRKAYISNNVKIISLNDVGELTYDYHSLDGKTQTIKDIVDNKHKISTEIINAKNPMIILGESFLKLNAASYLFNSFKEFLVNNKKFTEDWKPLNVLSVDASTVGNIDLDVIDQSDTILDDLGKNKFEIIFLVGQDDLNFKKKDEFIICLLYTSPSPRD